MGLLHSLPPPGDPVKGGVSCSSVAHQPATYEFYENGYWPMVNAIREEFGPVPSRQAESLEIPLPHPVAMRTLDHHWR